MRFGIIWLALVAASLNSAAHAQSGPDEMIIETWILCIIIGTEPEQCLPTPRPPNKAFCHASGQNWAQRLWKNNGKTSDYTCTYQRAKVECDPSNPQICWFKDGIKIVESDEQRIAREAKEAR